MSFNIFDDKDLVAQLLKHATDFNYKFTKGGQAAAAEVNANSALKQLLDSLESQLYPSQKDPNAPAEVSTESDNPVSLTSTSLEGLGALVSFLALNKITVNGSRIAYLQSEDPKNESYQLYRLEPNAGLLELADRTTVTNGFFVNKDLLVKYITSVQATASKKPNDVLRVQLGALVNQANKLLGTKLSDTYKEPAKVIPDTQVLDSFPQAIDPKNYTANGNAALTFADIKTPEAFNSWMQGHSIAVNGKTMADQDFDPCVVIQTIHSKARWLLSRSTSEELKNRNSTYVKQVEQIGPGITGPDGKSCSLTAVSPGAGANGTGADGKGGAGVGSTESDINNLISILPLRTGDIDFSRIKDFFQNYKALLNKNTQQRPDITQVLNAMANVENTSMPNATRMTENQMESFPLAVDVTTLATWLIPPKGQTQALSLVHNLRYVVSQTSAVIMHLKNHYKLQGPQLTAIIGQIGDGAESAGIAGVNLNHITLWENNINTQTPQPTAGFKPRGY